MGKQKEGDGIPPFVVLSSMGNPEQQTAFNAVFSEISALTYCLQSSPVRSACISIPGCQNPPCLDNNCRMACRSPDRCRDLIQTSSIRRSPSLLLRPAHIRAARRRRQNRHSRSSCGFPSSTLSCCRKTVFSFFKKLLLLRRLRSIICSMSCTAFQEFHLNHSSQYQIALHQCIRCTLLLLFYKA